MDEERRGEREEGRKGRREERKNQIFHFSMLRSILKATITIQSVFSKPNIISDKVSAYEFWKGAQTFSIHKQSIQ